MLSEEEYYNDLKERIEECRDIAKKARKTGKDVSKDVEIAWTEDLAERTEELVGPEGVAEDIKELVDKDMDRDDIAFEIIDKICNEEYSSDEKIDLVEQSIRTGLAVVTGGVVSAPVEGVQEVRTFKNDDGSNYVQVVYAGPIRSAGGTVMSLSVVMAWYASKKLGFSKYKPSEKEVKRYQEEFRLYSARQVTGSEEDVGYIARNCPIMIHSGTGQKKKDISINTDIENIDDTARNQMRGTTMLVVLEGVEGRAPKILRRSEKQGVRDEWDWLEKLTKGGGKSKEEEEEKSKDIIDFQKDGYLEQMLIGRPVYSYAQHKGGFALRYGKGRTTSMNSFGLHPSTTKILGHFASVGTQFKISYPGKGCTVQICDAAEPPVVKLDDGSVIRLDSPDLADEVEEGKTVEEVEENNNTLDEDYGKEEVKKRKIEEVLFEGEMIVPFGDVEEAGVPMLPSAWNTEWWQKYVKEYSEILPQEKFESINQDENPSAKEVYEFAEETETPLHPYYTYPWKWAENIEQVENIEEDLNNFNKPYLSKDSKRGLELLLIPHTIEEDKIKITNSEDWVMLNLILSEGESDSEEPLEYVNDKNKFEIKDRWPTIIGARMGRPTNKPEIKSMKPPVKGLWPLGSSGGNVRRLDKSMDKGSYKARVTFWKCPECGSVSPEIYCYDCDTRREKEEEKDDIDRREIPIKGIAEKTLDRLNVNKEEIKIKLIKRIVSEDKIPEPLEKGILRSKHNVPVFKTGNTMIDQTISPLTSFKPKDVSTSIEKLKELGYDFEDEEDELGFYPQDIIVCDELGDSLVRIANFMDELLEKFYDMEPYYNAEKPEDLVGKLIFSLAPHTSVAVPLRLVGYSSARVIYNHPIAIGARRRDCISGKEVLPFKVNGSWQVDTVNKLYKFYSKGYDLYLPSTEGDGKVNKLKGVYKRSKNRPYRITAKGKGDIFLTPGHKVPVGSGEVKKVKNLEKGDVLKYSDEAYKSFDENPLPKKLDLIDITTDKEILDESSIMVVANDKEKKKIKESIKEKYTYRELTKKIKQSGIKEFKGKEITKKRISNYIYRGSYPIKIYKFIKENLEYNANKKNLFIRYFANREKVPAIIDTNDIMYLVGLIIGDGYMREFHGGGNRGMSYHITLAIGNKKDRRQVLDFLSNSFNKNVSEGRKLTMNTRVLYTLIKKLFGKISGSMTKTIPSRVLQGSKEQMMNFLGGYIFTDGCVVEGAIRLTSANRKLISGSKIISNKCGLNPSVIPSYDEKPGKKIRERYKNKNKDIPSFDAYELRFKKRDTLKVANYIKGRKSSKANQVVSSDVNRSNRNYNYGEITNIERMEDYNKVYDIEMENKPHKLLAGTINAHIFNSDGDADEIGLALDWLVNFSKSFLSSKIGGLMGVPIMAIKTVNQDEIDDQAYGVDTDDEYPLEMYENAEEFKETDTVRDKIQCIDDFVEDEGGVFLGCDSTVPTDSLNVGCFVNRYVVLSKMENKFESVYSETEKMLSVPQDDAITRTARDHLISDYKGNMRAYSQQEVRCAKCNKKFRRMPLSGKCPRCDRDLINTVNEGNVTKYVDIFGTIAEETKSDEAGLEQDFHEIMAEVNTFFRTREEKEDENQKDLSEY